MSETIKEHSPDEAARQFEATLNDFAEEDARNAPQLDTRPLRERAIEAHRKHERECEARHAAAEREETERCAEHLAKKLDGWGVDRDEWLPVGATANFRDFALECIESDFSDLLIVISGDCAKCGERTHSDNITELEALGSLLVQFKPCYSHRINCGGPKISEPVVPAREQSIAEQLESLIRVIAREEASIALHCFQDQ